MEITFFKEETLKSPEKIVSCIKDASNSLVVKALDSQSRVPVSKTTGWLQGRLNLPSFRGRANVDQMELSGKK